MGKKRAATSRPRAPIASWGVRARRSRNAVPKRRDWASLDEGAAGLIAERVLANEVADYVRCRQWRRCCDDPRSRGVLADPGLLPRRWIMLVADNNKEDLAAAAAATSTRRQFLNTSTGQCVHVDVPELRDHAVLRSSTAGLLVLFRKATGDAPLTEPDHAPGGPAPALDRPAGGRPSPCVHRQVQLKHYLLFFCLGRPMDWKLTSIMPWQRRELSNGPFAGPSSFSSALCRCVIPQAH